MHPTHPALLLLALLSALAAAAPSPHPSPAPIPAPAPALAPRNKVIGPTLSPSQQRKLASLKSQYNSLRARTKALASQASSLSRAQAAASRSLSTVSRAGASLEALTLPASATATPVPAPASGCTPPNQVAAPGPIGPQDPICVPYCFPEALANGKPTFGRTTILRPGDNVACRSACRAQKASQDVDLAYYAVGQGFSYTTGFFRAQNHEGVACHCVLGTELKARVKAGLAGKGKGCGAKLGGSGGTDSLAVFAIDPDSV